MAEVAFSSQRNHTRIKFEPLSCSCSLVCITPDSTAVQAVDSIIQQWVPDRSLSPTVIQPEVRAYDIDNIFGRGAANEYLSLDSIAWLVDDVPIDEVWTSEVDYDIVTTADDTRGSLKIYKNFAAGQRSVIRFSGEFLDWRTGHIYKVESDTMALTCTDKGADTITCQVDKPLITYDPLYDDLLLYDYKVARGLTVTGNRSSHRTGKAFEQDVNVLLTVGTSSMQTVPSGMSMRLVVLGSNTAIVPNSESHPEVLNIAYPTITFDMRLVGKGDYEVQFIKNNEVVCRSAIGLCTVVSMPADTSKPLSNVDLAAGQKTYFNTALINLNDAKVDFPELYYLISWFSQARYNDNGTWKYASEKAWQKGLYIQAPLSGLDVGFTQNNSFFDLWFNVEPQGTYELLLDEAGNVLTDENDNYLIG